MRFTPIVACILALTLAPVISASEKKGGLSITFEYGNNKTRLKNVWDKGKTWVQKIFHTEENPEQQPTMRRRRSNPNQYQQLDDQQLDEIQNIIIEMSEKECNRCLLNNIACSALSVLFCMGGCMGGMFCGVPLGAAADSLLHALQNNGTLTP